MCWCVPGLDVSPAVRTVEVAGRVAEEVGEVGVGGPGGDGELLQCRHAGGGRAQGRQVERSAGAQAGVQTRLGI